MMVFAVPCPYFPCFLPPLLFIFYFSFFILSLLLPFLFLLSFIAPFSFPPLFSLFLPSFSFELKHLNFR